MTSNDIESFVHDLPFKNTAFGFKKRVRFILGMIDIAFGDRDEQLEVLEIGCGTGKLISIPLAQCGYRVTGVDIHQESIDYATELAKNLPNATFRCKSLETLATASYDIVICSEVLEHITEYAAFFKHVIDKVNSRGIVIITVPNGRGPFELQQRVRNLAKKTPIYSFAQKLRKRGRQHSETESFLNVTNVHVNFFRYSEMKKLFAENRMRLNQYEGRSFLCGFWFKPIFWLPFMIPVNDWLGSVLPSRMVSGWMFAISRLDEAVSTVPQSGRTA